MNKYFFSLAMAIAFIYATNTATAQSVADTTKKVVLKVTNLHCNNDMPTIKKRLLNQEGIDDVTFTDIAGTTSTFTITYHTSVTNQPQIEQLVETTPGCDDKNEMPYRVKRNGKKSKQ